MARRTKQGGSDAVDPQSIPASDLRPPRDKYPSDEEWRRACFQADMLEQDLRKIEEQLTYPGQIKVTVIRETRAVEYAK